MVPHGCGKSSTPRAIPSISPPRLRSCNARMRSPPEIVVPATDAAIARAARLIAKGELVAFATETVYGLGGDATSDRAVARIFAVKGRPRFNPLIVHVPGVAEAERLALFDERARRLARQFWPGPLSL